MKAVIILAHGSRAPEADGALYEIVDLVREKSGFEIVKPAYMDHSRPDMETAVKELIDLGIKNIIVMPLFLFSGIHVRKDIPGMIQELQDKYDVEITYARNLGPDRRIADIVVDRIMEVS